MIGEEEKGKQEIVSTEAVVECSTGSTKKKEKKAKETKKSKSKKRKKKESDSDDRKSKKKHKKEKIDDDGDDHHEKKEEEKDDKKIVRNSDSNNGDPLKKKKNEKKTDDDDEKKIQASLKKAYQDALQAYKADKANKDLRRAKSMAKKAWDERVIAAAGPDAIPLQCRNCSQLFMFTDSDKFKAKGWGDTKPQQCKSCTYNIDIKRSRDKQQRQKIDDKQNMCYEFQKSGTCSRGDRCKFSHSISHIGKKKQAIIDSRPICRSIAKGEICPHGDQCRFRHNNNANDTTTTATKIPAAT